MRAGRAHTVGLALAAACGSNAPGGVPIDGGEVADDGGVPGDGPPDAVVPAVPPEIDGRLTLNELMAANALTLRDESGAADDWIELHNPTDQALVLDGYGLTDLLTEPGKHRLGPVTVPAGGHLLLWADGQPEAGPTHLGFKLDAAGGELGLARPDGSYIDRIRYGAQTTDLSAARSPDGSDGWTTEWLVSPGGANADHGGQPMGLEDPDAAPEEVAAAGDVSERLLGYDVMPAFELRVSPDGVAALEANPFVYVPATLVFAGRAYGPVGLRLKGQNSFLPFSQKPSLRINVDEYVAQARFLGLKDLTLNNMSGDLAMMHERLAYWVMRHAGVPASRANHALLTVNGQFYGLYSHVETVKRPMLGRWFADDRGPLFEATDVDFVAADVPAYELETGPDDRSLLAGLAQALTLASADAAITAAASYADLARFRRFWAVCAVIGQFDSFPYSNPGDDYFVYADPTSRRLAFLPWGMDETFYADRVHVLATHSVLARRCQESPACLAAFVAETWTIQALTEQLDLLGERARVMAQIAPYVAQDTRKPYSDAEVAASQSALYWFISERRRNLSLMLPPPP